MVVQNDLSLNADIDPTLENTPTTGDTTGNGCFTISVRQRIRNESIAAETQLIRGIAGANPVIRPRNTRNALIARILCDYTDVAAAAEKAYNDLEAQGLEVLFDDRNESPGVKFNDADLLGIPIRVTISPRTLEKNSAEIKKRSEKDFQLVPLEGISSKLTGLVSQGLSGLSNPV